MASTGNKLLFLDRDGTLVLEPENYQVDRLDKIVFYPGVFYWLGRIVRELDFTLVMVTNQDGLGTEAYPEARFQEAQDFILRAFEGEGIHFHEICVDRSFASEQLPTRKPNTGMLTHYLEDSAWNVPDSFVIGDRITDVKLAANLGCKGIWINNDPELGASELAPDDSSIADALALSTSSWETIFEFLRLSQRRVAIHRKTRETDIAIVLDLDGNGEGHIDTGLAFFDHMLDQLVRHAGLSLELKVQGDLQVDEHHTIEDTALALGEAFRKALGDKTGTERYGFVLPMDDCQAQVAIDFGGRPWMVWDAVFTREKIGEMPTEMFFHFFKSFSDAAACNLNIKAEGQNEHHKIESIFKAWAKAIKMAKKRDVNHMVLPSTKGVL